MTPEVQVMNMKIFEDITEESELKEDITEEPELKFDINIKQSLNSNNSFNTINDRIMVKPVKLQGEKDSKSLTNEELIGLFI